MKEKPNRMLALLVAGIILGIVAVFLTAYGNPGNMAICTACFIRDVAGSMGFHSAEAVQYFRPELVGLILGAFFMSLISKDFRATYSENNLIRFLLGVIMAVSALVFLGCTLRMVLRMSAGDISAYIGLLGLLGGVWVGSSYVKKGFTLGRSKESPSPVNGSLVPIGITALFALFLVYPALFKQSEAGPGSMHAPIIISLVGGLIFGLVAQKVRLCFTGSIRDFFLAKDYSRLLPIVTLFVVMVVYNILAGHFHFVSYGPIAHQDVLWNILSMFAVGFAGVLANGCPVRQVILSGSGSGEAGSVLLGMFTGAALAHNFKLASAPNSVVDGVLTGGPTTQGMIAVVVSIIILFILAELGKNKGLVKE